VKEKQGEEEITKGELKKGIEKNENNKRKVEGNKENINK
jgi:hypothetical protein